MHQINTAAKLLKEAIIAYFSESVEVKINRAIIIMLPIIVVGAYFAWYIHNK